MNKPYIISINAVSGGGKTALAKAVHAALPAAELFCFDDFSDTNVVPDDLYAWSQRGANLLELDCPGLAAAVEQALKRGTLHYIVLDYPLGREHPRLGGLIDLAIFIDTPLDVAMARRILRETADVSDPAAAERLQQLRADLRHYLEKARYPYLNAYTQKATSDLVLDGWRPLEALRDQVLARVQPASHLDR